MGSKESTALLRTPFDVGLQPGAMGFTQQSSDDAIPHVVTASNLIYNHRLPLEKREGGREGGKEGGREGGRKGGREGAREGGELNIFKFPLNI